MSRKIKNNKEAEKGNKQAFKYVLAIMGNFTWMYILYQCMIMLGERIRSILPYAICSGVFLAAATILLGIYYFCTTGETDAAKKEKYKPLFLWAFPLVIVLLLDVLGTVIFDYIINMFS